MQYFLQGIEPANIYQVEAIQKAVRQIERVQQYSCCSNDFEHKKFTYTDHLFR